MTTSGEKTAPGDLEVVRSLLNTSPRRHEVDPLAEPGELRGWLAESGLLSAAGPLDLEDIERMLGFRQAVLGLVPTSTARSVSSDTVTALNHYAWRTPLVFQIDDKGEGMLEPAGQGVDAAVANLLAIIHVAMVNGTWRRLKRCANRQCHRAFYDKSKNASGRWCSMEACGNVANARAYRKRQSTT